MNGKCYVNSMALVSCQKPLSDEWFLMPDIFAEHYVRAQEPDSKEFIVPSEARRMSRILRRTICTSITALNRSGISQPDAIITGTGMGCFENTEKFLIDLSRFGESCLKPSLFMQSTHNTISSLVAIVLKCRGYNNTFSHKDISFESALLDAMLQLKTGAICNALIGSHDEMTPFMALVAARTHPEYRLISETSMSAVVSAVKSADTICEVSDVAIMHRPDIQDAANRVAAAGTNLLMVGTNGNPDNDAPYSTLLNLLPRPAAVIHYKSVFGENHSAPAAGFYAAATIINRQKIPPFMTRNNVDGIPANGITLVNFGEDNSLSVITLKRP